MYTSTPNDLEMSQEKIPNLILCDMTFSVPQVYTKLWCPTVLVRSSGKSKNSQHRLPVELSFTLCSLYNTLDNRKNKGVFLLNHQE